MALQNLRSSTANKRPVATSLSDGQIALNINAASPGIFFKNSSNVLTKVGPIHIGTSAPNSSPAGSSGNAVGEQWMDTSGSAVVMKVWDGSAWQEQNKFGAVAGTAAAPSIYFAGDTDTGIYSPGANQLAISTSGTGWLFVDAAGRVGIGTANPGRGLVVDGVDDTIVAAFQSTATGCGFGLKDATTTADNTVTLRAIGNNLVAHAGGTERARIDSSGRLLVGTSTAPQTGTKFAVGEFSATGATYGVSYTDGNNVYFIRSSTDTFGSTAHYQFYNPNGIVGNISTSGSVTAYNTSSDYRLKENVVPLTGAADRVNQLQVRRFNFIADPDTTVDGFLAHEAQAVVPECVTGTKDEVDDDGNPVYQGIDQSKLVPLLTAALQEALAKIGRASCRERV